MQISSRFTIAVHILLCIDTFQGKYKLTSEFLASSVHVNPVIIRKILSQLKAAGIVEVQRGSGGASIVGKLEEISFLDIYRAVESVEKEGLFHFHESPNPLGPGGRNIHQVLDGRLIQVQNALERELEKMTLADVVKDARTCMAKETE